MKAGSVVSGIACTEGCTQGSQEPVEGAGEVIVRRWDKKSRKGATSLKGAQVREKKRQKRVEERVVCLPMSHPGICAPYTPYNY